MCALGAAVLGLLVLVGCRRAPAPPYQLAFAIQVHSPHVLEAGEETAVPVVVANVGQRGWDPTHVHVSYHWLWLVPRELASRSRNVPYHDGIRTELTTPVPPRGRLALEGRLLAPTLPGVYWLQWDMVDEGVTWFAQVSPRQPRSLVVVVPPPVWLFAPLPLLIALVGIAKVRSAAGSDVAWCAACLVAKPLILIHDALLEPTAVAYWLIAVVAVMTPVLTAVVVPRRARAWMLVVVGVFASLVVLADVVYYRFFGDVLSAPALLAVHQAPDVSGSIRNLITADLLWLVVDWPFAVWLALRLSSARIQPSTVRHRATLATVAAAVLALAGLLLGAPRVLADAPLDQMFRDRAVVEQLGVFGFHAYDAWNYVRATRLRPAISDAQLQEVAGWFRSRAPLRAGTAPAFGIARHRNLIVVQVESLQDFVIDFRVGNQEVMPHLRRWVANSLRFTNVTDETSEGRTSDGEFTMMASLLPLAHGAVAFRYPGNHYIALPRVLAEHGYHTQSAVAFEAGFWNRRVMHPSYGFQRSFFEPDFQLTEQIGWGLDDYDFLQQMVPRLEQAERPFAAWLITLSLHHPFDNFPDRHKVLKLGALEGTSFGNYLHTMRFFDDALEAFVTALARDRLLDDSVIVVFGDHDAGFRHDPALAATIGIGSDEAAWALNDRVPLFIRVPDAGDLHGVRAQPAGQTDLAPTILSLLGIDAAPLPYVGRNLLGAREDSPIPRPYGDWLDSRHLFFARGADQVCYDIVSRRADDEFQCAAADEAARRERQASALVVSGDLQQRLWRGANATARPPSTMPAQR